MVRQITITFVYVGIYMCVCVKNEGFLIENILQLKFFLDLGLPKSDLGWL